MNPIDLLLNLLLGLAMGTVGGLFGIGGGLVAIPALGVLFGLDQQLAQGTALVMVVPNVVLALWRYHQRNRIELKHALLLSASGFACAWLASLYAVELQAERMRLAFVAFLVALALYNLARLFMRSAPVSSELRRPWPWLGVLGGAAGALGGLFGVGGAGGTDAVEVRRAVMREGLVERSGAVRQSRNGGGCAARPACRQRPAAPRSSRARCRC